MMAALSGVWILSPLIKNNAKCQSFCRWLKWEKIMFMRSYVVYKYLSNINLEYDVMCKF